jgi:hypothetical protein
VAVLLLWIAVAALAQVPAAPSEEPVPSEAVAQAPELKSAAEKPTRLGGFDLGLTVFNSSGVYFGPEGYSNTLTFWLEPSFAVGKRFFKGSWFERLAVGARLPIEVELAGSDPRFRGSRFGNSQLINAPESLPILAAQSPSSGNVDGLAHHPVLLGDAWLSIAHGKLFRVPLLGVDVSSSLRMVLPTSLASRNAGLVSSLGLGLALERKFFDSLTVGYAVRPTKYFYSRTQGRIAALGTSVEINGRAESTWTPQSTGVANPSFGLINGFWAQLELPRGFALSLNYFLFNTRPYEVAGGCGAAGVPLSNLCTDGAQVGDARAGVWRNEHWFLGSVDYSHSFWELSLGLSTFRPVNNPDGAISQPFFEANRNNYTTVYLSFAAHAEALAQYVAGEGKP